MAQELGGWKVSSNVSQKHRATISIRVPADQLDSTVLRLRDMAVEVEAEVSTSKDVTDEYVDTRSRLENLRATEKALLRLMERAEKVEEALNVQKSLTQVQGRPREPPGPGQVPGRDLGVLADKRDPGAGARGDGRRRRAGPDHRHR